MFDSGTTPPCVGLLPTVFWRQPGVERSLHPTHSVCARGALAHRLTVGHQMDDTAVGPHSPFMQLAVVGGKLLFIGDILEACTFMHGIEDIVRPPWLRYGPKSSYTVDGVERRSAGFGEGTPQQVADQGNKRVERNLGHGSILALTV